MTVTASKTSLNSSRVFIRFELHVEYNSTCLRGTREEREEWKYRVASGNCRTWCSLFVTFTYFQNVMHTLWQMNGTFSRRAVVITAMLENAANVDKCRINKPQCVICPTRERASHTVKPSGTSRKNRERNMYQRAVSPRIYYVRKAKGQQICVTFQ